MSKRITLLLCLLVLSCQSFGNKYVFFLHNMFLELYDTSAAHAEYGKVEYYQIIEAFKKEGFTVISEIRPKNTDGKRYAQKVVKQVDSLIATGVKPGDITVLGTSKGGYIAQYVSSYLKNEKVNFVFIGCCMPGDDIYEKELYYYGHVLSIYEKSDNTISCEKTKNRSASKVPRFKEIQLNTGLKHGFLYKALPVWLTPSIRWAKQQYE